MKPVGAWLPFPHALWSPSVTNTELGFVLLDNAFEYNAFEYKGTPVHRADSLGFCILCFSCLVLLASVPLL